MGEYMGVFLFIKVPMKTSVILVVLALVALSVAQSCSIISGSYLCFNPATTSDPSVAVNPRVSIDLEGNTRTFRVVYPNNECTYQGDADISSNGSTLTVSTLSAMMPPLAPTTSTSAALTSSSTPSVILLTVPSGKVPAMVLNWRAMLSSTSETTTTTTTLPPPLFLPP